MTVNIKEQKAGTSKKWEYSPPYLDEDVFCNIPGKTCRHAGRHAHTHTHTHHWDKSSTACVQNNWYEVIWGQVFPSERWLCLTSVSVISPLGNACLFSAARSLIIIVLYLCFNRKELVKLFFPPSLYPSRVDRESPVISARWGCGGWVNHGAEPLGLSAALDQCVFSQLVCVQGWHYLEHAATGISNFNRELIRLVCFFKSLSSWWI